MTIKQFGRFYDFAERPDACPICHTSLVPSFVEKRIISAHKHHGLVVEAVYQCPSNTCSRLFIATYCTPAEPPLGHKPELRIKRLQPQTFKKPEVPHEISRISPRYLELLSQSAHAEALGLSEVAGMGYRKALEFLVKDYATYKWPDKSDDIKSQSLTRVINNYLDTPKIKQCAERAAWLGNDESHYVRKHDSHDLKDLKNLLELTKSWVLHEIQTDNYLKGLNKA